MALIGFARVSTQQQDLSEQIQVLKEYGEVIMPEAALETGKQYF